MRYTTYWGFTPERLLEGRDCAADRRARHAEAHRRRREAALLVDGHERTDEVEIDGSGRRHGRGRALRGAEPHAT